MTVHAKLQPHPQQDGHVKTCGVELPAGTSLCNGQYTIERYLNSGGFGNTYLARDSLDRRVVIKECFPNLLCLREGLEVRLRAPNYAKDFEHIVGLFQREARALAKLTHAGVVTVHQIFEENCTAYMALDYIAGLDLFEVMESYPDYLTPQVIRRLAEQVLVALDYVHENGIIHRDISPDNILLDAAYSPVLIDFGASRVGQARSSRVLSRIYTVKDGYSPQEFYFEGRFQSPASDLYALAATLYHLITGTCPPNSSERLSAISEEEADPYVPLKGRYPAYPPAFTECIDTCMALFSKDRLQSASDWLTQLDCGWAPADAEPAHIGAPAQEAPPLRTDHDTLRQISSLVESSRLEITQTPEAPEAPPEVDREAQEREEQRAKQVEYWAILNEDPEELARAAEAERAAEEAAKAPPPPPPEETPRRSSLSFLLPWRRQRTPEDANLCG